MVTERKSPRGKPITQATGRRRAAALMIALGPEASAEILRQLSEEDVAQITWEIVGIGQLTPTERE